MKILDNFCLTEYNSYKVESFCKKAFFPQNENDLTTIVNENEDFVLIGSGHNIILSKNYYESSFIIFNGNFNKIEIDLKENIICAEAGASLYDVSVLAQKNSLAGVEFFYDIPSSIGGAVMMNAGTKEGETKNVLLKVRYLDIKSMQIKEKLKEELELEYRNSIFQKQKDKIILKAWFQLVSGDSLNIKKMMDESKKRRWLKQPREYPNSGSVFKRPSGKFVGPMLDQLGLKGFKIGGAQVSEKHSGFIVNYNNATGDDILTLIKHIQDKVKKKFDIDLEVEQRII